MKGCSIPGRTLRVTGKGRLVMVNNEGKRISILKIMEKNDLDVNNIFEISKPIGSEIVDFKSFGDWKKLRFAILTKDGYINTFEFGFENKVVEKKAQIQIDLEKGEEALSLAVSGDSKLFAVHTRFESSKMGSKIVMLELANEKLFKKLSEYDLRPNGFEQFLAFDFQKIYEKIDNVVFCAATFSNISSKILHFTFDRKKNILSELVNLRRHVISKELTRFSTYGDDKAILGSDGKLITLKYGK